MDPLSLHFASTLLSSNRQLEQRASLTKHSLSSLTNSLNEIQLSPFCLSTSPTSHTIPQALPRVRTARLPSFFNSLDDSASKTSSPSSRPKTTRRNSWSDARSCRNEERRRTNLGSDSESESDGETQNVKLDSFPPRRPSPHPLHRRVRSDPGPVSYTPPKRDLRRALLKRRATLTQQRSSQPPPPQTPTFTVPPRPRRSNEHAQKLRLQTFNFPRTSASPFLHPSPAPSSVSSFSSSANSVSSKFSDDSDDSDSSSSGSETSESDGEDDDFDGKPNPFDLSLDLFPPPPSPTPSH